MYLADSIPNIQKKGEIWRISVGENNEEDTDIADLVVVRLKYK